MVDRGGKPAIVTAFGHVAEHLDNGLLAADSLQLGFHIPEGLLRRHVESRAFTQESVKLAPQLCLADYAGCTHVQSPHIRGTNY